MDASALRIHGEGVNIALVLPTWCPAKLTGAIYNVDVGGGGNQLLDPQVAPADKCRLPCVTTYFCLTSSPVFSGIIVQSIFDGDGQVIAYSRPDVIKDLLGNVLCTVSYTCEGAFSDQPPFTIHSGLSAYFTGPPDPATPWKGTGASSDLPEGPYVYGPYHWTFVYSNGVNVTLDVAGGPSAAVQVLGPYTNGFDPTEKMGTLMVPVATSLSPVQIAGQVSSIPDTLPVLGSVYGALFTSTSPWR